MMSEEKDFFISYHDADREWAEWIAWHLEEAGYSSIVRAWDFLPGHNWVMEIENALNEARSILVVFSPDYLAGGIHRSEWAAAFAQDTNGDGGKLIPVYVRPCTPPRLLATLIAIDLVGLNGKTAKKTLINGIKGMRLKPSQSPHYPGLPPIFPGPSNVLIASLGDSPVVVTAMYDLLTKQEELPVDQLVIDRIFVLYPEDEERAYEYVKEALADIQDLQPRKLPFEDANTWENACIYLKELYNLLNACQEKGDTVYLSLAGGRKSMAALTAWVAPLFPCIEGLYHIIDKQEENFFTTADLDTFNVKSRREKLRPKDLSHFILVELPFRKGELEQQDFENLHKKLRAATSYDLGTGEFEEEKLALITSQEIRQKDSVLLKMTKQAAEQFIVLRKQNLAQARFIYESILQMHNAEGLYNLKRTFTIDSHEQKHGKRSSVILHSFTNFHVPVRPIFYTLPRDVYTDTEEQLEKVIICSLDAKSADDTRSLTEIAQTSIIPVDPNVDFFGLPPVPIPAKSILIVPLGTSPMVATQLYTLLKEQQQRTICEVVLIYPQLSVEINNSADVVKKALREEYNFKCTTLKGIPNLEDITSKGDCQTYQKYLETEIIRVKEQYPGYKIDLALSGGRKGMTAMTIFAALKNGIPYVYCTLITDKLINRKIEYEDEATVKVLRDLSKQERNDRLFLRAYSAGENDPYAHFTLFRVPVFTADGW